MSFNTSLKFDNTDLLHDQFTSFHVGVVKKVNDHEGRGRVRVEVPGLRGTGEENWTDWIDVTGNPIGGQNGSPKGDTGIWWPLQPGQSVIVGHMTADPDSLFCIPGFAGQSQDGENQQNVPTECKSCETGDHRDPTKIFQLKAPDGSMLKFDTREGKESLELVSRKGSGLKIIEPSKLTADPEQKTGESKYRKSDFRDKKTSFRGDADSPSSLKNNEGITRIQDIGGNSMTMHSKDGQGIVAIQANPSNSSTTGPSLVFDSKSNSIILTAGNTQLIINGTKGQVEVTKQVIQEKPFTSKPGEYLNATQRYLNQTGQYPGDLK